MEKNKKHLFDGFLKKDGIMDRYLLTNRLRNNFCRNCNQHLTSYDKLDDKGKRDVTIGSLQKQVDNGMSHYSFEGLK